MHKFPVLFLAALACSAVAVAPAEARKAGAGKGKQPNIVVIMTDDQATTELVHMPNVKKLLTDRGTSFSDAVDSFPLCCPARATFITGQYAHNHKVIGNFYPYGWYGMKDRGNILPAWLQKSGYRTGMVGKWLNGYGAKTCKGEKPKGFDVWRGLLDLSSYDYFNFVMSLDGKGEKTWGDAAFAHKLVEFGNVQVIDKPEPVILEVVKKLRAVFGPPPYTDFGSEEAKDYSVDVTGDVFAGLLEKEKSQKKPFFMWWSPASPHREDVASSPSLLGRPGADPRPPNFNQDEASFAKLPANMRNHLPPLTDQAIAQLQLNYEGRVGSLLAVDDHVAKIVKKLKATGQYENTTIIFTSDNGWMQGEHRVPGDKFLPYEESLRVPFIVAGPGIPKGRKIKGQVTNVDFAPTILDLAGAKPGRTLDGVSLLATAKNPKKRPDRAISIEAPEPLFASASMPSNRWDQAYKGVRTDDWKYIVYKVSGGEELYDLKADPFEINNLAADPAYAAIKAKMIGKLAKVNACAGAKCRAVPAR